MTERERDRERDRQRERERQTERKRETGWLGGYTVPIGEKTTMQEKQLHEKNMWVLKQRTYLYSFLVHITRWLKKGW